MVKDNEFTRNQKRPAKEAGDFEDVVRQKPTEAAEPVSTVDPAVAALIVKLVEPLAVQIEALASLIEVVTEQLAALKNELRVVKRLTGVVVKR